LAGKTVCFGLDGWSNVHNEPIICETVTTSEGQVYLVDTVDTSGRPHTAEYLKDMAASSIAKTENDFKCSVGSIVTDNAANVKKMRTNLEETLEHKKLVTYGCSAHILNLLAHDLEIPNIKDQVVHVIKYFRNNHFASATYRADGNKALVMPQDVRWNTMAGCLNSYIDNWPALVKICENEASRDKIDNIIKGKVTNMGLKRSAEELRDRLNPIAIALDKMQSDKPSLWLSISVKNW
ncbi:Transposase, partial [Caligus rogercresseyi]